MIAVDAMGGDFAPRIAVQGALAVAKKNVKVGLYGDQVQLFSLLYEYDMHWERLPIQIIHCAETISMSESPAIAVIKKSDASLVRAICDVRDGKASAIVSAGNSGAILAGSSLLIGRVAGVKRPAIGAFLSTHMQGGTFCIDLGANVDCRPEHLVQFAIMGHVYSKMTYHVASPRIGLLSNGHEPYKGSSLIKKTYQLLKMHPDLHFIGNVEPDALFNGQVDVLVTDGFAGNVMLKTAESLGSAFFDWIAHESQKTLRGKVLAYLSKSFLHDIRMRIDHERRGGALLLGIRQPVIVAHGSSHASAMAAVIMLAHKKVKSRFVHRFGAMVAPLLDTMPQIACDDDNRAVKNVHSILEFDKNV